MKITSLVKEFLSTPRLVLKNRDYIICVLSGEKDKWLREDKRRLNYGLCLAKAIIKAGGRYKLVFVAYSDKVEEFRKLLTSYDERGEKIRLIAESEFDTLNTKIQLIDFQQKIKGNKREVIVVSDSWHLPRIRRYLQNAKLGWQIYSGRLDLSIFKIINEIIKIRRYRL